MPVVEKRFTGENDRKTPCARIKLPVTAGNLKHKEVLTMDKDIDKLAHTGIEDLSRPYTYVVKDTAKN